VGSLKTPPHDEKETPVSCKTVWAFIYCGRFAVRKGFLVPRKLSAVSIRIFGISMCAQRNGVCEEFRKLKITKEAGLCLGFFSLNETPQQGCRSIYGIWRFICIRGKVERGRVPLRKGGAAPENGFAVFARREAPLPR
jgi:hypothetical protein